MIEAELSFTLVNDFTLRRARKVESGPVKIPDEAWDAHFVDRGGFRDKVLHGSLPEMFVFYDELHQRVLEILKHISSEELSLYVEFWGPQQMEIAFRLVRYDSHLVQHTIHIEKTSAVLSLPVSEAKRLNRRILNVLAAFNGLCLMMDQVCDTCEDIAGYIRRLAGDFRSLLKPE